MKANKISTNVMASGSHLKNRKSKGVSMFVKYLALMAFAMFTVSCGNVSNQNKEPIEPKLSEEEVTFCEDFFIARQVDRIDIQSILSLLKTVRANGYKDVMHAFSIPNDFDNYQQREAYIGVLLQDLGIDPEQQLKESYYTMVDVFGYVYGYSNSKLRQPELKSILIEELDNGNRIWIVKDYQSMTQARLIVKKDGALSIGNVTDIEN